MRVALGLKARTGSAALVIVGEEAGEERVVESSRIQLLPDGDFAPYHAAEELEPAAARESVRRAIAAAHRLAEKGLRDAVRRCEKAGHAVSGCGVLVGPGMPAWSTEEILAVHFRMHKAEGELFRDVLVAGAKACHIPLVTLPDKSAPAAAAEALQITPARLDARLAALGAQAGPPWRKEQKEAAAAALVALAKPRSRRAGS